MMEIIKDFGTIRFHLGNIFSTRTVKTWMKMKWNKMSRKGHKTLIISSRD